MKTQSIIKKIVAAISCLPLVLTACSENFGSDLNNEIIDVTELCGMLTLDELNEMGVDCNIQNPCVVGFKKCDGLNVLECVMDGNMSKYVFIEMCTGYCQNGECVSSQPLEQVCEIGTIQCSGVSRMECIDDNGMARWAIMETCSSSCQNGECVSSQLLEHVCEIGTIQCSGVNRMECIDDNGISKWTILETCTKSCKDGQCSNECAEQCKPGSFSCSGKTLEKCELNPNGCYAWNTQKDCTQFCYAETGRCAEELPTCKLYNNSHAQIIEWVDGDTLWARPQNDGTCNNYEYDSSSGKYVSVRFNIRIHGIDAPECTKAYNGRYRTCIQDSKYTDDNEPYGYEAWQAAVGLLPADSDVILTCDEPEYDGTCPLDATGHRELAYVGYIKDNASYDYSTEMARLGMAFSNTKFTSSKRRQICMAQKEAQNAEVGIWSSGGLSQMGSGKRKNLKNMEAACKKAMK